MMQHEVVWPDARELACLVRAAQGDSPSALESLLASIRPSLLRFFASRLARDVAEDLTQCALLRISGALKRIDPERADAYVMTVARNLLRTAYRRRHVDVRRHADIELDVIPEGREASDSTAEYDELVRAVHRVADSQLPPLLADIVLSLLRGDAASEIAERQGVSPVTIRTRLLRARRILRRELRGHLEARGLDVVTEQEDGSANGVVPTSNPQRKRHFG